MIKIKREKFYVYSDIFEAGLSAREIAVFAYLSRCANKDGVAFPSMRRITDKCKISYNTVLKCLEKLESIGFIHKKNCYVKSQNGRIRQTSNKYFIKRNLKLNLENTDEAVERAFQSEQGGASKQTEEALPTEQGGASKQTEEINNKLNNIKVPLSVSQYEEDGLTEILGAVCLSSFEPSFAAAVKLAVTDLYYSERFVIGGRAVPRCEVRSRLARLDEWAVRIVFENISRLGCKVSSLGNYLKVCLYNAALDGETCAAVIESGE